MTAPLRPGLHDLVYWRGAKWLITRVLQRGRLEIKAVMDPTVLWTCLESQLTWDEKSRAWICRAYLVPTRGSSTCDD